VEATEHVVSIRHGVIFVEAEAVGTAEGVGCTGDEDAVLGLGDEVEGVVGVIVRRQECLRHLLPPESVVGWITINLYYLPSGWKLM
jgi:hypothetical protein